MPQYSVAIHEDADDLLEGPVNLPTGSGTVIPGVLGQIIVIYKLFLVAGGTTVLTFNNGATALSSMLVGANDGQVWDFDTKPWFTIGRGNDFTITSSASVQVSGRIYYNTVSVEPFGYVTEDGLIFYVAEDGTTYYVQEEYGP